MDKLQVNLVLELLGRPKEHMEEAVRTVVTKLGAEKGVRLVEKKYNDAIEAEEGTGMFTTFAEVSVECEGIDNLFGLLFAYMPSHVEIISPEKISMSNSDLNTFSNEITGRLHEYVGRVKTLLNEREVLARHLHKRAPELFKKESEGGIGPGDELKKELGGSIGEAAPPPSEAPKKPLADGSPDKDD